MTITRATTLALNAWTRANRRAGDDYATRPSRSCHRPTCDQLVVDGMLCPAHTRDNGAAARRASKLRGAR